MNTVTLEVPSTNDEAELLRLLQVELAMALYGSGRLSPGRAAKLAGLDRWGFGEMAKARGIATPYTIEMIEEDFAHGGRH